MRPRPTGVSTENNNTVSQAHDSDVERTHLTQGATQVQIPAGEAIVRVQVTPGETIQLPFPNDRMMARLDDGNGNLAIKVGDVTVILQGYIAATGEADVNLIDNAGQQVDAGGEVLAVVLQHADGQDDGRVRRDGRLQLKRAEAGEVGHGRACIRSLVWV